MKSSFPISTICALCISVLPAVGTQAAVDDYGDLIPISELQAKFNRTGDKTYQHLAQARCAAVLFNVANVFEIVGAASEAEMLKMRTANLIHMAEESYLAKVRSPDDSDKARARETTMEEVHEFNNLLGARLKENQRSTGEAFNQDEVVMSDMQTCAGLI